MQVPTGSEIRFVYKLNAPAVRFFFLALVECVESIGYGFGVIGRLGLPQADGPPWPDSIPATPTDFT